MHQSSSLSPSAGGNRKSAAAPRESSAALSQQRRGRGGGVRGHGSPASAASPAGYSLDTVMQRLWETSRQTEQVFTNRRVTDCVLSLNERRRLQKLHNKNGGIRPSSVTPFREIMAQVLGVTFPLSDSQLSSVLEEQGHALGATTVDRNGELEIDADTLILLAAQIKRHIVLYDGLDAVPELFGIGGEQSSPPTNATTAAATKLSSPTRVSAPSLRKTVSVHEVEDEDECKDKGPSSDELPLTELLLTHPFTGTSLALVPVGSEELTPQQRRQETEALSPTSREHSPSPSRSVRFSTIGGVSGESFVSDMPSDPFHSRSSTVDTYNYEQMIEDEAENERLEVSYAVFMELGGNLSDPTSTIPVQRARRFVTAMLLGCGESENAVEHHVSRFERIYETLSFHDFDTEVVAPIFRLVPKRILDSVKRKSRGVSLHRRKSALDDTLQDFDTLKEDQVFATGRSFFFTAQRLYQHHVLKNNLQTTGEIKHAMGTLVAFSEHRDALHQAVMLEADNIFQSRCVFAHTPFHHLAPLRPAFLQRYLAHMAQRRRVVVGRRNVVVARFTRGVALALQLLVDHQSRCTYCRDVNRIRDAKHSTLQDILTKEEKLQMQQRQQAEAARRKRREFSYRRAEDNISDEAVKKALKTCSTIEQKARVLQNHHPEGSRATTPQGDEEEEGAAPAKAANGTAAATSRTDSKARTPASRDFDDRIATSRFVRAIHRQQSAAEEQTKQKALKDVVFPSMEELKLAEIKRQFRTPLPPPPPRKKNKVQARKEDKEKVKKNSLTAKPPLSVAMALQKYRKELTDFEKKEIKRFEVVYFVGGEAHRDKIQPRGTCETLPPGTLIAKSTRRSSVSVSLDTGFGGGPSSFDDCKGNYKVVPGDHLAYRFEVLELLGEGPYGQLVKTIDHKEGKLCAVKIFSSQKRQHRQAEVEWNVLEALGKKQIEKFVFRGHVLLVGELATGTNLTNCDFLALKKKQQQQQKKQRSTARNRKDNTIIRSPHRSFVRQLAKALLQLAEHHDESGVIHTGFAPRNIAVVGSEEKEDGDGEALSASLLDYGSATLLRGHDEGTTLLTPTAGKGKGTASSSAEQQPLGGRMKLSGTSSLQERYYRAPEVLLGLPVPKEDITSAIDVWSIGCIVAEVAHRIGVSGTSVAGAATALFPGENEVDQLQAIMEYLGVPPETLLERCPPNRKRIYFQEADHSSQPHLIRSGKGQVRYPGTKDLALYLRCAHSTVPGVSQEEVQEDELFVDFLLCLLEWDPVERWTSSEALQHQWLRDEVRER